MRLQWEFLDKLKIQKSLTGNRLPGILAESNYLSKKNAPPPRHRSHLPRLGALPPPCTSADRPRDARGAPPHRLSPREERPALD